MVPGRSVVVPFDIITKGKGRYAGQRVGSSSTPFIVGGIGAGKGRYAGQRVTRAQSLLFLYEKENKSNIPHMPLFIEAAWSTSVYLV